MFVWLGPVAIHSLATWSSEVWVGLSLQIFFHLPLGFLSWRTPSQLRQFETRWPLNVCLVRPKTGFQTNLSYVSQKLKFNSSPHWKSSLCDERKVRRNDERKSSHQQLRSTECLEIVFYKKMIFKLVNMEIGFSVGCYGKSNLIYIICLMNTCQPNGFLNDINFGHWRTKACRPRLWAKAITDFA